MAGAMIRISEHARTVLRRLAAQTGLSTRELLDEALEAYRRQRFLEDANAAFGALKKNKKAWKAELEERRAWDKTLADGLHEE